jgi:hypothetical protein
MRYVSLLVVGGSSFLLLSSSRLIERYTVLQYLNLVAWLVALVGLFSAAIAAVVCILRLANVVS